MKCIATVILMALAVAAEASYATQIYAHHGHGYVASPYGVYAAHHGSTIIQSNDDHQAWAHHDYWPAATYHSHVHHAPPALGHWDHHRHAHAAPVLPNHHTATYVAVNPGAVHKAPLPGHIVNQKSLNLAPASGLW
ncbi:adult cuticle protein 1-like [Aedes albopictus]|uniref:Cuticle protein n=1 Tax=Aedes albopictus TaxID=7160 RepID=A0ABM1YM02_AEDAL|nr:adult cuticle protein 1-like [Aedes albopictus]